jgi:RND family efflux transporter MFP subunit
MESHDQTPQNLPKIGKAKLLLLGVVVLVLFAGLFLYGFLTHRHNQQEIDDRAVEAANQPPTVNVVAPKPTAQIFELTLPGDARAMQETALYARVNGYFKRWTHDIQDHVEAGELLAEIAAPDLDAQYDQAKAALEQANANVTSAKNNDDLAQATLKRYQGLEPTGGVTQQDLDQRQTAANQADAAYLAAQAQVKSAQANVEQLTAQKGFEKIVAPFAGTITARNYDIGALISPTDTAAGHELFRIAETDRLRIYVNVPQSYVTEIQPGQEAFFTVRNYPDQKFSGKVARSAGVLDPNTRTLFTEVDFDNSKGQLFAGMYGQVIFNIHRDKPVLTVPSSAMMFESDGTQLAIVDGTTLHFRKVKVGRDFGTEIEILSGLDGSEQVVSNPGEKIGEGITVNVAENSPTPNAQPVAQTASTPHDPAGQDPPAGSK